VLFRSRILREQATSKRRRDLERRRKALEAQVKAMWAEFQSEQDEVNRLVSEEQLRANVLLADRDKMAGSRSADASKSH